MNKTYNNIAKTIDLINFDKVSEYHKQNFQGDGQAENSLLAGIMNNPSLIDQVNTLLTEEMFFNLINRLIFSSMLELKAEHREINEISLMEKTRINKDFLVDLRLEKFLIAKVADLSLRVTDAYYSQKVNEIVTSPEFDVTIDRENINEIIKQIQKCKEASETTLIQSLAELMIKQTTQAFIMTGNKIIDEKLFGFPAKGFVVVAGRPKMGKTSLMVTFLIQASHLMKVAYLTIEMNADQIVNKIKYMQTLKPNIANISIVDYSYPYFDKILVTISKLAEDGVKIVFLDYLQLIKTKFSGINEVASLSTITLELKLLAKRMDIVIVTGSQFSRGIESRDDKRPLMSDLKGSGSIEQDADLILGLHREKPEEPLAKTGTLNSIYILANRHGQSGVIKDLYMFPCGEFREQTRDEVKESVKLKYK